jgi:hypothetical protein
MSTLRTTTRRTTRTFTTSRVALATLSVAGTIAYAASFALCDSHQTLAPLAAAVGVSAGAAWVVFGLLIRVAGGSRAVGTWVDACLQTQAVGIVVLILAAAANAGFFASADWLGSKPVFPVFVVVHAGLLLVTDVLMGTYFVMAAQARGLKWARALAAWVLGLNGIFAIVLTILVNGRVFS